MPLSESVASSPLLFFPGRRAKPVALSNPGLLGMGSAELPTESLDFLTLMLAPAA